MFIDKKTVFCLLFFCFGFAIAQNNADKIEIENGLELTFYQYGERVKPKKIFKLEINEPGGKKLMKKAKVMYRSARTISIVGTVLVIQAGVSPSLELFLLGLGVQLGSIPFYFSYRKHVIPAVEIYNKESYLRTNSQASLNFGATPNGLGLTLNFH